MAGLKRYIIDGPNLIEADFGEVVRAEDALAEVERLRKVIKAAHWWIDEASPHDAYRILGEELSNGKA